MRSFLLVTILAAFAFVSPAISAEEKKLEEKPAAEKSVVKKEAEQKVSKTKAQSVTSKNTPITKWEEARDALYAPLTDKDKESVFIMQNKHDYIRVTQVVEKEIGTAIKSCGKNNPDIKEKMDSRFKQWQNAVMPLIPVAEKQLDKDVDTQTIVSSKKLREVFKLQEDAYDYGQKMITKQPVSTKEACEDLLKSMDRTENNMVKILQETLLPEGTIRKRADDMKKAKEKADKQAAKKAPVKKEQAAENKSSEKTETKAQ